jgi:RNA polymerase sigma-70 factor (ECF subfamily)
MTTPETVVQGRHLVGRPSSQFPETEPSVVERARRTEERQALSELCAAYWHPVYCFLRSKGCPKEEAADVTQGFFTMLLESERSDDGCSTEVAKFNPERQRFRSWLRTRAKWYFLNWIDRKKVVTGAAYPHVPVDLGMAEAEWQVESKDALEPDRIFDRCWAKIVVRRARARLQEQYEGSPKRAAIDELLLRLCDEEAAVDGEPCAKAEQEAGAVRTRRSRLKGDLAVPFRRCLRAEIGRTVPRSQLVDDEIDLLLHALSE